MRRACSSSFVVGEGDGGVGGDEPEGLDAALYGGFDDVGIGEAACGRDAIDGDVPDAGEVFAILRIVEFAIAGERRGEAGLARAHGVALAGDGEGRGAGASDVAGDEGEVVDGGDGDGALRGVVDAHGPADEGGFCSAVEHELLDDWSFGEASDRGDVCGGEVGDECGELFEAQWCGGRCSRGR